MMINNLKTIYPISPLLEKYIYCYYIIENTGVDFKSSHYSFPHTFNAVSIYDNGTFLKGKQRVKVMSNNKYAPFATIQGKCQNPLLVELEGAMSRITILFKPLGLNSFIKMPLGHIMGKESSLFTQWDSEPFTELLNQLFRGNSIKENIALLETFLFSVCKTFDQSSLSKSLDYLSDFNEEKSIEEIATLLYMPLRTFNRLFRLHLGISPVVHRQIARFRQSLENKMFDKQFKNLKEIGYMSNFYDQSYFNKLYKQLSGSNPKTFFKEIEKVGESKLVFQFIKSHTG